MSVEFYRVLHLSGVVMVFFSLGAILLHSLNHDGTKLQGKTTVSVLHGLGMLFLLVAGFGIAAKKGLGFPVFMYIKLFLWLILGALYGIGQRKPALANPSIYITLAVALCAVIVAVYHARIFSL